MYQHGLNKTQKEKFVIWSGFMEKYVKLEKNISKRI